MQLTIGSNRLSNTDGVINVRGDEQIAFEWGKIGSELLLTMDLYNITGSHIARLRRNRWTFNDRDRFVFTANPTGISLVDSRSSQVTLEARVTDGDSVVVTRGRFNSSDGRQIEVTSEDWEGVANSQVVPSPIAESTKPTFKEHEIVLIREAVLSSEETVECPRCAGPLTRTKFPGATQRDTWLVSCIMCGRNVVVSRPS